MDASLPCFCTLYICTIVHRLPNACIYLLPSWHSLHRTSTRIPATPPLFDVKGPGCRMACSVQCPSPLSHGACHGSAAPLRVPCPRLRPRRRPLAEDTGRVRARPKPSGRDGALQIRPTVRNWISFPPSFTLECRQFEPSDGTFLCTLGSSSSKIFFNGYYASGWSKFNLVIETPYSVFLAVFGAFLPPKPTNNDLT